MLALSLLGPPLLNCWWNSTPFWPKTSPFFSIFDRLNKQTLWPNPYALWKIPQPHSEPLKLWNNSWIKSLKSLFLIHWRTLSHKLAATFACLSQTGNRIKKFCHLVSWWQYTAHCTSVHWDDATKCHMQCRGRVQQSSSLRLGLSH